MKLASQFKNLRKRLGKLASRPNRRFYYNYMPVAANGANDRPKGLGEKLKQLLPLPVPLYYLWSWDSRLNYASHAGQTALCWSELQDRDMLRAAALRLDKFFKTAKLVPVLVTPTADFPFFVRLGWQVEYLPRLAGSASYARKKARYLALRYRDAILLPIEAGLASEEELKELLQCQYP